MIIIVYETANDPWKIKSVGLIHYNKLVRLAGWSILVPLVARLKKS